MKRVAISFAAAAGLLLLYFGLLAQQEKQAYFAERAARLTHYDADGVTRIKLERQDPERKTVILARAESGDWWLEEPLRDRADETNVNGILNHLADKTTEATFAADELARYALDPPRFSVTLYGSDGSSATYAFGKKTPMDNMLYARRASDPAGWIVTLRGGFQHYLKKPAVDFRSREVFYAFPEPVTYVGFVTETASWAITRAAEGTPWYADGVSLATSKVDPLLSRIRNLSLREFLSDDAAADRHAYDWPRPTPTLTVAGADGKVRQLQFARPLAEGENTPVWIKARNQIATVSGYVYDSLWKTPAALKPEPATTATTDTTAVTEAGAMHVSPAE